MSSSLLAGYSLIGLIEVIVKMVFIINVKREKTRLSSRCTKFYFVPPDCVDWRLDDLNLTNSVIFHIISSIVHLVLILFSIQLFLFARKISIMRRQLSGIDNNSFNQSISSTTIDDSPDISMSVMNAGRMDPLTNSQANSHQELVGEDREVQNGTGYGTFRRICNRFRRITSV